jgi:hypothetical protein
MSEFPDIQDVRNGILCGQYDNYLSLIKKEIKDREIRTREFIEWVEGDRVKINEKCRPKYLYGVEATITGVRRTRVSIRLSKSVGRFSSERDITIPTELLDKVM